MLCHWRYVLDHVFAPVKAVSCMGATQHSRAGSTSRSRSYAADVDDAAYAILSSKAAPSRISIALVRAGRRDDPGDLPGRRHPRVGRSPGSRAAGPSTGQHAAPGVESDVPQTMNFFDQWKKVRERRYDNGFKIQWEDFIRHVVGGPRRGSTIWSRAPRRAARRARASRLGRAAWLDVRSSTSEERPRVAKISLPTKIAASSPM